MSYIDEKLKLFKNNKVVSWHEHVSPENPGSRQLDEEKTDMMVRAAKKLYIDKICVSRPIPGQVTPEDFKKCNDIVYQAMRRYPDYIKGFAFVNAGYAKEAIAEINRCINELGMIGLKLYNPYYISDPALHPVIEKCIDIDIPILVHAGKLCYQPESQPFISNGIHFAQAARNYPEAVLIEGHIGGGGDWQWSLKAIADSPTVFTDISGTVIDEGIIEQTVKYLGAERVLFAADGILTKNEQCVGKILNAKISGEEKIEILNNKTLEPYLERGL